MTRLVRTLIAFGAVASLAAFASVAAQSNPILGTWKLNVAKSKYSPGPAPQSQTNKYDAWDGGLKLTTDGVDAKGAKTHSEYAAKFDGKPYPFTGNPNADMITLKRVDDRTLETQWSKGGKPTILSRSVISADGKTRTITQTGVNAQGQKVNNVIVYERQ
jgi:hypothetical protein